jgi:hypothetical protein
MHMMHIRLSLPVPLCVFNFVSLFITWYISGWGLGLGLGRETWPYGQSSVNGDFFFLSAAPIAAQYGLVGAI